MTIPDPTILFPIPIRRVRVGGSWTQYRHSGARTTGQGWVTLVIDYSGELPACCTSCTPAQPQAGPPTKSRPRAGHIPRVTTPQPYPTQDHHKSHPTVVDRCRSSLVTHIASSAVFLSHRHTQIARHSYAVPVIPPTHRSIDNHTAAVAEAAAVAAAVLHYIILFRLSSLNTKP